MKRNTSFARNLISNYEGSPQIQKIELKRQKKITSKRLALLFLLVSKMQIFTNWPKNKSIKDGIFKIL